MKIHLTPGTNNNTNCNNKIAIITGKNKDNKGYIQKAHLL